MPVPTYEYWMHPIYRWVGAEHGRNPCISGHRPGIKSVSRVCSDYYASASVLVLGLRSLPFYGITHIVEYKDRDGRHALPLFGTKRFVKWLPRLGEFLL